MKPWPDVAPLFSTTAVAHLATLRADGSPHSVPVWVGVVPGGDDDGDRAPALELFSLEGAAKDANIRRDPRVAFSITLPDNALAMATVRGEVVERLTGDAAVAVADRLSQQYQGQPYEIRSGLVAYVVRLTAWWSNDYATDETERSASRGGR